MEKRIACFKSRHVNVCCGLGIHVFQNREALFNCDCIYNYLGDSGIKYVNFHNKKNNNNKKGGMPFSALWSEEGFTCRSISSPGF